MNDEMYKDQAEICIEEGSLNRFLDRDHSDHLRPTVVDQDHYDDSAHNLCDLSLLEEHLKEREDAWKEKVPASSFSRHGSTIKILSLTDGSKTTVDARDYPALSEFNWSRGSDGSGRMYV